MKTIVIVMKALLGATFVWMILSFFRMIDRDIIDLTSIFTLLSTLRNVLLVGFYWLIVGIMAAAGYASLGLFTLFGMIPSGVPLYDPILHQSLGGQSREMFFAQWIPQIQLSDRTIELLITKGKTLPATDSISIQEYIGIIGEGYVLDELQALGESAYLILFQVLAVLLIIYGILSVIRNEPRYSLRAILFLNLMVVFPLILFGVENLLGVFMTDPNLGQYIGINQIVEGVIEGPVLPYPIKPGVVFMPIPENFGAFIFSPIFQIAIASFLYLEFTFQLNYVYQVTSPSEQRAERLYEQIQTLKRASQEAVIHLEKIEAGEPTEIIEEELDEEGNVIEKAKVESVRKFLSKTATGFSFIREMIERRKLENQTKRAIEALKDTRRLSNYLNHLFEQDPEAEQTLTAKNSAPQAGRLIRSTVIDMVFRIAGITFLVFIISKTPWIIEYIFRAPESIVNSVEMYTPEVILTLFIPLVLMFPFISIIIRVTKMQQLRKKTRKEEENQPVTDTSEFVSA
ncbi:MAG: hypothetical protein EU530_09580 [Promethearchaeota archaeon]|nr:MAG: hypothetical protein EU530_09580 [Candidatus Lokiarchaeota archaeon]